MERNDMSLRYDNRTFVRRGESRPSRDVNVSLYRNKLAGLGASWVDIQRVRDQGAESGTERAKTKREKDRTRTLRSSIGGRCSKGRTELILQAIPVVVSTRIERWPNCSMLMVVHVGRDGSATQDTVAYHTQRDTSAPS